MRKLRSLSVVLVFALVLATFSCVGAAAFNDVPSDKYSWAVDAIDAMTAEGIIKGYEDKTFRPERTVTKLESLVLTARVLGFNEAENKSLLNAAIETYGETIEKYDLNYGDDEVAYLIMKNIISASELSDYIGTGNAAAGMKRYEIAVLLTKALDADSEVSQNVITSLEYADATEIPAFAKKYVEYVTNKGLMQGMESNKFSPNTDVTRAQAAVLLNKLMNMTQYSYNNGLVASINPDTRIIKIKGETDTVQYTIGSSVFLRFEGKEISAKDIATGYDAVVTLKGDALYAIDFVTPLVDKTIEGVVSGTNSTAGVTSIAVYEMAETDTSYSDEKSVFYPLADNCVITYDGDSATLREIEKGTYVNLIIKNGKITVLDGFPKTSVVNGIVTDLEITPVCKITLDSDEEYIFSDSVSVTKNGSKSELSKVLVGDKVELTTTYGRVSKVVASSKTQEKDGIITEVIISASPKLTLKTGEDSKTYPVSNNCIFDIPGKTNANFYDLRAGATATVEIEGDTIVEISTNVSEGITQVSGTVVSVNVSYGVIQISYVDSNSGTSVTEPVFVKGKSTIIDITTGNSIKLSNIKVGEKVTAFGSRDTGVFDATTVNVVRN